MICSSSQLRLALCPLREVFVLEIILNSNVFMWLTLAARLLRGLSLTLNSVVLELDGLLSHWWTYVYTAIHGPILARLPFYVCSITVQIQHGSHCFFSKDYLLLSPPSG